MPESQDRTRTAPASIYCRVHNQVVRACPARGGPHACLLSGECQAPFPGHRNRPRATPERDAPPPSSHP